MGMQYSMGGVMYIISGCTNITLHRAIYSISTCVTSYKVTTGYLIRRRIWSVTYTSPWGIPNLEFAIEEHFRTENFTSFLAGWKTLPTIALQVREPTTSRTPILHNKQGFPHATRSAMYILPTGVTWLLIQHRKNIYHGACWAFTF